jgi:ELWxxDGT repeat protein
MTKHSHQARRAFISVSIALLSALSLLSSPAPIGAAGPTTLIKSIGQGIAWSVDIGGGIVFGTSENSSDIGQLWKSDGTADGTTQLLPKMDSATTPLVFGGLVFFQGCDATHGCELWKTDGTIADTKLVKDLNPSGDPANELDDPVIGNLTVVNETLYFSTLIGSGWSVWKSDGTAAGTVELKTLRSGRFDRCPFAISNFTAVGNLLFLQVCQEPTPGGLFDFTGEVWKSDGTVAGTVQVPNLTLDDRSNLTKPMVPIGSALYLAANSDLWKIDCASGIASIVKDFAGVYDIYDMHGTLLAVAEDASGLGLWKSNGTSAGTVLIKSIDAGVTQPYGKIMAVLGDTVFFSATDNAHGLELWKSDGTGPGTLLIKDINPDSGDSITGRWQEVNGTLFFSADDGSHGEELWKTDGTALGTTLVQDINPGGVSSGVSFIWNANGTLLFSAFDGVSQKLWKADALSPGAALVQDFMVGEGLSQRGDTLLLSAGQGNDELWQLPLTAVRSGAQASAGPAIGSTLVSTNPQGNGATILIPPGAATQSTTFVYTPITTETTMPPAFTFAGHAFTLDAYQGGVKLDSFSFQKPITVTLTYADADVAGLAEGTLKLYHKSGGEWVDAATSCTPASTYMRDSAQNQVTLAVCHLTEFGLFGSRSQVYVPLTVR